jgi:hypothetical protein
MSDIALTTTPEPVPIGKKARYEKQLRILPHGQVDVLIAGDSLAAQWEKADIREAFPGCRIAKMSMTGDRIQNTLWKVKCGDFDSLRPRIVVLIVGTNNLPTNTPVAIAAGIEAIVEVMLERWSPEGIFVVGVPPRGTGGTYKRARRQQANERLQSAISVLPQVRFIDLDAVLTDAAAFQADMLHLSQRGYGIVTEALRIACIEHRAMLWQGGEIHRIRQHQQTSEDSRILAKMKHLLLPDILEAVRAAPPYPRRLSFRERLIVMIRGRL